MLAVAALAGMGLSSNAQTGTYTILQQPCNNDGKISFTVAGLTPPLDFSYYDANGNYFLHTGINSLTDVLSGIGAPIYYASAAEASTGVYYSTPVTGMNFPFTVDPAVATNAICPSLTGTAQFTINGGAAPASVQWFNYASFSYTLGSYAGTGNPMTLPPGGYAAIVTDAAGCTVTTGLDSSSTVQINNVSGINYTVATTTAACTNGTASVSGITGGIGPYTYLWSNGASSSAISGLTTGNYSVTVTDAQGCSKGRNTFVPQSISISLNPVVTDATCLQTNGSIISFGSGGTPPYTYAYSNGMSGQSITGLGAGNITVTATDANGCTGYGYASVNSTTPINVTYAATPSSCTAATGTATLSISGGTAPYSIIWSTSPAMSGTTISGMPAGNYYFTVTDANGCVRSGFAAIPSASTLNTAAFATNPVCPATTGSITVTASGTNPPFTYLWNTGATTAVLSSVPTGYYSCTITDNAGCSQVRNAIVNVTSPVSTGFSTTPASCLYTADGTALVTPVGGTGPYTYNWSNGQTTATATGLTTGNYYVSVSDANGCSSYGNYTFVGYNAANTSCYCTITGKVYADANSNCVMDAGEAGIEHVAVHCAGYGYAFTDANGDYSFAVPSGTYTISEVVQYMYPLAACQSNAISVSVTAATGCSTTVDFANTVTTIHDMHVVRTSINNAVPGNTYTQGLIVQNDGTVNETGIQMGYAHDGQLTLSTISPAVYSQISPGTEPNWYSVTSGFPAMGAGTSTMIYFNDFVPTNIPLATALTFGDTTAAAAPMLSWMNDYTPWNNISNYHTTVVGSYDPNFKEVSPQGTGAEGFIETSDSVLDYVVHFQNTGSYYAAKVVVIDSLDEDLDWSTVRPGYSDHAYTATISEGGVLKFTFEHIHLPWQDMSEMGSRGLVSYSVKQKAGLTPGTEITNSAAIYFDYNAPVITNQTLNTIQLPAGISEHSNNSNLLIYPNPATDVLNIDLSNESNIKTVRIYDLQGRMVQTENAAQHAGTQKIAVASLVKGLYFVVLEKADGQKVTGRFIKD